MNRYASMFDRLRQVHEVAFIPFVMLGDPDAATGLDILRTLIAAGADALELGLPFSDPIADGPVIQAAGVRALAAGTRSADCWSIIATIRAEHPNLPIGLLVYANLVVHHSAAAFYQAAARAGVDSVLVADLPVEESAPFVAAAAKAGIAPVFIAPPNADDHRLAAIARASQGYTYVVTREGVTGVDERLRGDRSRLVATLHDLGAPPAVLGFGISQPEHVREGIRMGAAGVISGSAIVGRIAEHLGDRPRLLAEIRSFCREMKAATRMPETA